MHESLHPSRAGHLVDKLMNKPLPRYFLNIDKMMVPESIYQSR